MLSIDEAIEFYKGYNDRSGGTVDYNEFDEQIAEWLEELKALKNGLNIKCDNLNEALEKGKKIGYNKAIDDCIEIVKFHRDSWDGIEWAIRDIEQLKAGGK